MSCKLHHNCGVALIVLQLTLSREHSTMHCTYQLCSWSCGLSHIPGLYAAAAVCWSTILHLCLSTATRVYVCLHTSCNAPDQLLPTELPLLHKALLLHACIPASKTDKVSASIDSAMQNSCFCLTIYAMNGSMLRMSHQQSLCLVLQCL